MRSFLFWEVKIVLGLEDEEQRYGRNKETTINSTYINGGDYRRKFDAISESARLNRLLYFLAKRMLQHRSGTFYEDMYWIDLDTLKVVAKETSAKSQCEIVYSKKTKETISKYDNLLTIHSHPSGLPPSEGDLLSNYTNGYSVGIIVGHNGSIYKYRLSESIPNGYYGTMVAKYMKRGYNNYEAQKKALAEMQKMYKLDFEEVVGYGI